MNKVISNVIAIASLIFSGSSLADSAVYEISKGGHKLYLAGTLHLLRKEDFPLPAEYDSAYKHAQKVYFETDLQKTNSPEFGQRFAKTMLLPDNKTLKDILDKEVWKKLQKYSENNEFPLDQTHMFNPAMVGILMVLAEAKKMGAGEGVDEHYDRLARANNKFGGGLENEDDVLSYMQALNLEDPNRIVLSSLDDINSFKKEFEKLIAQWKRGDLDALDKNLGEQMRQQMPLGYTTLLVNRNKKWLPQIKAMLVTSETEMVMVGSLHLSGRDGLLAMLKKDGYKVTAYKIP